MQITNPTTGILDKSTFGAEEALAEGGVLIKREGHPLGTFDDSANADW